ELQVSCEGRRYSFEQDRVVRIGRGTDNDVVVSDPTVSRQHALLAWGPDGWVFEGLGRAGTFLHGSAVTMLPVREPVELALASPRGRGAGWGRRGRASPPVTGGAGSAPWPAAPQGPGGAPGDGPAAAGSGGPVPAAATSPGGPVPTAAMPRSPVPPRIGSAAEARDELASAVPVLVPVRSLLNG